MWDFLIEKEEAAVFQRFARAEWKAILKEKIKEANEELAEQCKLRNNTCRTGIDPPALKKALARRDRLMSILSKVRYM
jgi:hypothetical protein